MHSPRPEVLGLGRASRMHLPKQKNLAEKGKALFRQVFS